ncbi:E3 ubiquitin-protein ligase TRIM45-like [Saccostrea echinata]|uniref:E3 ubiquitin-protein ligase TRIM45-like n=1 Tax=Saccostrea echinata TaxID=191078 RepID=UPI002A8368AD|nr:E3 ubiquitin-protein ligase TRIM45-like [Saccostrea echinata]
MEEDGHHTDLELSDRRLHELEELYLTCSRCQGNFMNDDRLLAHLLPCLHTICSRCLHDLRQKHSKQIKCVVCGVVFDIKSDDVTESFPLDNTRLDLRDFLRMKKGADCISCKGDGKMASTRCVTCAEFLCDDCTSAHRRTTMTRNHEIRDLSQLIDTNNLDAFHTPLKCPLHKNGSEDSNLTVYCNKETCQKPVCLVCAVITCKPSKGHTHLDLKETAATKKLNMKKSIRQIQKTREEIQPVKQHVKSEIEVINELERTVEDDIDFSIEEMIKMLEQKRMELKFDLKKRVDKKRETLKEQGKSLSEREEDISHALKFAEHTLCSTNDAAFSQIDKTIMHRLYRLQHDPFDRVPHERAFVTLEKSKVMTELQQILTENLKIWSSSIFPPYTTIELSGKAVENSLTRLSVYLRDHRNQPVETGTSVTENLRITVADPSGKKITLSPAQESQSAVGVLVVSYVPFTSGKFELVVEVMRKDVSRLVFDVAPDESHPRHCEAGFNSIMNRDACRPNFTFDDVRAHSDVMVTDKGQIFQNFSSILRTAPPPSTQFKRFKGTCGSMPFQKDDVYFYEIDVCFWLRKILDDTDLVFEIGLALESSIDNKHHVEGQPYCWSLIGSHHAHCNAVCITVAHEGRSVFHQKISDNTVDSVFHKAFGFLVDMRKGLWQIFDSNQMLCSLEIDTENILLPVFAGYNPSKVVLNLTLKY